MSMLCVKYLLLALCFLGLSSSVGAQKNLSFEICEALTSQENPRLMQGLDNWLFSKTDLISEISIEDVALLRLKELQDALDYRGMEIIFVLLPSRAMMHYDKFDLSQAHFKNYDLERAIESYEDALEVLSSIGFYAPNVYEYLLANADGQDYAFKRDSHWLPASAALTAELVKATMLDTVAYEFLRFKEYEVVLKEVGLRDSDLARALNKQCKLSIAPEPQEIYELDISASKNTQQDLFIESQTSFIPLWGTSYSQTSNFAEFLQAELDVDIINYGYGAAGLWRSLRHYFLEKELGSDYPELVIWEIPYGYFTEFNFLELYKELVPAIYGTCKDDLALAPKISKELNQSKLTTLLDSDTTLFKQSAWQVVRASLTQHNESAVKMVFNGEKNPWLSKQVETGKSLNNTYYEFSVWLWTDGNQPKNVALTMFSGKDNVSIQNITLTPEPKLYTVLHNFSDTEKTSFTVRVDGLKKQWTVNSEGYYLYATEPVVRQVDSFELLRLEDDSVLDDTYYSQIEFEDTIVREFDLVYTYADGSSKSERIERDIYSDNNGKFFHELPVNATAPLTAMYVEGLMSNAVGSVSTQICKKPQ